MKQEFVELLRCPRCWAHLELTTFVETADGDEITDGVLRCGCGASYPIVDAIPRVLAGAYSQFPAFVERYRNLLNDISVISGRPFLKWQQILKKIFGTICTQQLQNFSKVNSVWMSGAVLVDTSTMLLHVEQLW